MTTPESADQRLQIALTDAGAKYPTYATGGSAGLDLFANEDVTVPAFDRKLVHTGNIFRIPRGWAGLVCSRSGLALKSGIEVLNAPGIIDSDYRGEVCVILFNTTRHPFEVRRGDRIAQMVVTPHLSPYFDRVLTVDMDETIRGAGGFGSTGR
jgi:dUTP pyrophosphatase